MSGFSEKKRGGGERRKNYEEEEINSFVDWVKIVEPQCYQIGISPKEFEELQPHEVRKLFDAHVKRTQLEDFKKSYFLSWLVNLQVAKGKKISPRDIYEPLHPEEKENIRDRALQDHDDILDTFHEQLLKQEYLNPNIRAELEKKYGKRKIS